MARFDESLVASQRALELSPLEMNIHLAWHYYFARDYELTLDIAQQTLEMDSTFVEPHWFRVWACEQEGRYDEAIAAYQQSLVREKQEQLAWLGHVYAVSGNKVEALKLLDELKNESNQRYISPYWVAIIYLGLNDNDGTFEYLRKAFDERNAWLVYLNVNPIFDSLRSESRFEELLRRIGLAS